MMAVSSLNLTAANASLHNITANLMDMLQGLISDREYNIKGSFTKHFCIHWDFDVSLLFLYILHAFKLDQFTLRKSLVLEKFLDADFELLKDILKKVILEINNIQRNKKSSAKTKSRPNTKDTDYKLRDITIRDPHNSKEGKNGTSEKECIKDWILIE
ncbi:hypothetical protein CEXT_526871 [Caerostris extrusa]|uniref:Uncharacterized protein n=1 Tax=Caerostris extrusa TaxID=172846 RepID=A0AAV4TUC6_CAEEX|nr:hypothetical protein CEXT_526871 [Caerostris extrusa]